MTTCAGCINPRNHPNIDHSPEGSTAWCMWIECGHPVFATSQACQHADHPTERENPTMSDDTTTSSLPPPLPSPAKRGAARKATAPTPAPEPVDEQLFSVNQQRRLEALKASKDLLGRDVTAGELLDLAQYIEYGLRTWTVTNDDEGDELAFEGPTTTEGTNQ